MQDSNLRRRKPTDLQSVPLGVCNDKLCWLHDKYAGQSVDQQIQRKTRKILLRTHCGPGPDRLRGASALPQRTDQCDTDPVRAIEATELLACDVFNTGARQITLGDIQRYLSELRSHPPQCTCGRCRAAALVRADRVLMIVRVWQRQVAATRTQALR